MARLGTSQAAGGQSVDSRCDFTPHNIVEHPELVDERIVRYAGVVGCEHVIAGSDCGFSSRANSEPEVHPTVVWAKFEAMAEGARLATRQVWG